MWAIVRRSLPKRGGRGPSRGQTISAFALKHSQESEEKADVVLNSEKNVGLISAVDNLKVPAWPLTKTVATVGPVSEDSDTIQKLVDEKMKIMRINFSHATYEEATKRIERLRDADGMHVRANITTPFRKHNVRVRVWS